MKASALVMACVISAMPVGVRVLAQEGLATTGTIHGQNTIQQATSGGRATAVEAGGGDGQGKPTVQERRLEQHNNDVTQICKGC